MDNSRLEVAVCCLYVFMLDSELQRIQNVAGRLLTGTKKFDHITPVLKSLIAACEEDN